MEPDRIYFNLRSSWPSSCAAECAPRKLAHTLTRLAYNLSVKVGWLHGIVVLFVFQLFTCQWRQTRSGKGHSGGDSLSSMGELTPRLLRLLIISDLPPAPIPGRACDVFHSNLSSTNMSPGGHGVTIMVADRRRLQTVGGWKGGAPPCPYGPLGLLSHSAPPDTRGREPARPRG